MQKHMHLLPVLLLTTAILSGSISTVWAEETPVQAEVVDQTASTGLSLQQAINMALEQSPRMQNADAVVKAAAGERSQAGLLPNPLLSAQVENAGGNSAPYRSFDSAENTFGVSQLIEIGGKRSARVAIAEHGQSLSRFDQMTTKLDLIRDVKIAYMQAVAMQETVRLTQEQTDLANKILGNVNTRVNAAAEPLVQRNKATIALATAEVALERAKREQAIALKNLALLWGSNAPPAQISTDDFYDIVKMSDIDAEKTLTHNIDYERDSAALSRAKAAIDLEEANAVPDPTIMAGVRDFRQTNNQAFVIGVSIPLPAFNQNSGNIERARQEHVQANANRQRAVLERRARLNEQQEQLQATYTQIGQLKEKILPQSTEALKQAEHGYGLGRFAYLEVLDAQRTLADSRLAYLAALLDYHTREAQIERLIAAEPTIKAGEKKNEK